jgi:hypothetical protein
LKHEKAAVFENQVNVEAAGGGQTGGEADGFLSETAF